MAGIDPIHTVKFLSASLESAVLEYPESIINRGFVFRRACLFCPNSFAEQIIPFSTGKDESTRRK